MFTVAAESSSSVDSGCFKLNFFLNCLKIEESTPGIKFSVSDVFYVSDLVLLSACFDESRKGSDERTRRGCSTTIVILFKTKPMQNEAIIKTNETAPISNENWNIKNSNIRIAIMKSIFIKFLISFRKKVKGRYKFQTFVRT